MEPSAAQEDLIPDAGLDTGIFIVGIQEKGFETIPDGGQAVFPVRFIDISIESAFAYTSAIPIRCKAEAQDDQGRWTFSVPATAGYLQRNDEITMNVILSTSVRSNPMIFTVDVVCTAGSPVNDVVGRFSFTAKVDVYQFFSLQPHGAPPRVGPDEQFSLTTRITNMGNDVERFSGRVEAPPGFIFESPPNVLVSPGESKVVEITGLGPRDQIWYRPQMAPVQVTYWPESDPDREQTRTIGVNLSGFYFHPALVPFILLAMAAIVMLVIIVVFARRTVEEQVLGKPVPPWRIPIEKEYLVRLEKEDPDEFYIVRYHLMVEEHESALLWYKHFKHATRKDRKHERVWLKKKEKIETKTGRLERRHGRMKAFVAWRLRRVPRRRRRRLARLDKKLHHDQWKEQRKLLKIHRKSVKRIDEIHSKRKKQLEKDHSAQFAKEESRIAKENRKRVKRGEEPLPLPEEQELQIADPDFPQVVEVPILPVQESRFAVRAERLNARFNRKIARRTRRAQKKLGRKQARLDKKTARLKAKVPPEPVGELYREDEFVSEDEVVVEDARPVYQRALRIPPMETRDALKRRRLVYRAKIAQAKNENDPERVERLKEEYAQERARLLGAPAPQQRQRAEKKKADAKSEESVNEEDAGGGALRLMRRRGRKEGKGGNEEGAVDAANQGAKDPGSVSEEDGSSRGDRSTED